MEVVGYVAQVRAQLLAAAAIGGDAARATADALATAAEPAVRLALLGAISDAANEITAALLDSPGAPVVALRIDGADLRMEVRHSEPSEPVSQVAAAGADDTDNTARISLRLPEALKVQIESAARGNGVSANTWLLRAAATALSGGQRRGRRAAWDAGSGHRVTGWING